MVQEGADNRNHDLRHDLGVNVSEAWKAETFTAGDGGCGDRSVIAATATGSMLHHAAV